MKICMLKKSMFLAITLIGSSCLQRKSFSTNPNNSEQNSEKKLRGSFLELGTLDTMQQLLQFETKFNLPQYTTSLDNLQVESVDVKSSEAKSKYFGDSFQIQKFLALPNQGLKWFKHPYNKDSTVPFFDRKTTENSSLLGRVSSSRSLFFGLPKSQSCADSWYSIKLPTDYIRPKFYQARKAHNSEELEETEIINNHVTSLRKNGFDTNSPLYYLSDVAIVYTEDKTSQNNNKFDNGYMVRDLRPLCATGSFYVPAFSLGTFAGSHIQEKCTGKKPSSEESRVFWRKWFAESVGTAKAEMLFEFGLIMWTPNAQNWLLELDKQSFCPTGKVVVRDIVDSRPSREIFEVLGKTNFTNTWKAMGRKTFEDEFADKGLPNGIWKMGAQPHMKKLWDTLWRSPWEFDETFTRATVDSYFNHLEKKIAGSEKQSWKNMSSEVKALHANAISEIPAFMEKRKKVRENNEPTE